MHPIIAEITQEMQDVFQGLTEAGSVSLSDVEEVSSAVASWGQQLSEAAPKGV